MTLMLALTRRSARIKGRTLKGIPPSTVRNTLEITMRFGEITMRLVRLRPAQCVRVQFVTSLKGIIITKRGSFRGPTKRTARRKTGRTIVLEYFLTMRGNHQTRHGGLSILQHDDASHEHHTSHEQHHTRDNSNHPPRQPDGRNGNNSITIFVNNGWVLVRHHLSSWLHHRCCCVDGCVVGCVCLCGCNVFVRFFACHCTICICASVHRWRIEKA